MPLEESYFDQRKGLFLKSFKFKARHLFLAFHQNLVPSTFLLAQLLFFKTFALRSLCPVLMCGWMIAGVLGVCFKLFMGIRGISLNPQPTTHCPLQILLYNPRFYEDLKALRLALSMP